jgi:hypothetical protein
MRLFEDGAFMKYDEAEKMKLLWNRAKKYDFGCEKFLQ